MADQTSGRSVGAADGEYPNSQWGLGGNQGGVSPVRQPGPGLARTPGNTHATDGSAAAGPSDCPVPSGYYGIGLYQPARHCGFGTAELRGAARAVPASYLGGDPGRFGLGGGGCLDVGARTEGSAAGQGKPALDRRLPTDSGVGRAGS